MFSKKYIDNISGLQIFQLLRFGTLLLISIVFAKSSLLIAEIGFYEMFLFVAALLCSFWINGLIQSFLPLYRSNNTFEKTEGKSPEIFNVFLLVSILSLLTILALVIFNKPLSNVLNNANEIPYFKLILIYIFFNNPSFLIEYIYLVRNESLRILKYGAITFSLQFVLISTPAILGYSMEFCIQGLVLISIVRYGWLLVLLKKYALFTPSINFIKEHIYVAYPLIISSLLGSSAVYVDSFLVLNKFDTATFAIFKYGAREFPLVLLMANALSTAMIPDFSVKKEIGNALISLRNKSGNLMHLLFPITMLFLVFSNWLYPRIFNENFTESASIFNIYLLLIISRLVFPQTILIGLKKTKIVMYASFVELVINIILSIVFLHFWGIEGIAFATLIAFASQKIIWLVYIKLVLKISPLKYLPVTELTIYSMVTLGIFYFVY